MIDTILDFSPRINNRIYYEITSICNLRCIHCNASFVANAPYLDSSALLDFHARLCSYVGHTVDSVITGGEPTLHKDFKKIVSELSKYGNVVITTNGTVINPKEVSTLLQKHPNVMLQISVDGASQSTFEAVRGPGTYEKVMTLIDYLLQQGLEAQIGLSMVVMKHNFHEIHALLDFAQRNKIASLHFPALLPVGFAKVHWQEIALSPEQQIEVDEIFLVLLEKHVPPPIISVNWIGQIATRLAAGLKGDCLVNYTLKVDADGNLLPCPATSNKSLALGNIAERDLPMKLLSRIKEKRPIYLDVAGKSLVQCFNCFARDICAGRFCANCGLLSSPDKAIVDHFCKVLKHHYYVAIQELKT